MSRAAAWPLRAAAWGLMALSLSLAAPASGCRRRPAPPAPDVAARAGGTEIRYAAFQAYLSRTLGDADTVVASDVLSQLFDQFLEERLLLLLAVDRGLVPRGGTPLQDAGAARHAIDALLQQADEQRVPRQATGGAAAAGPAPSAAAIEAYYGRHRQEFARPERVRLRQILTEDRRTAERARQAIQRGEDFSAVARRLSRDAAAGGGYQGELARADLPPALVDIVFGLRPGEVSRVVPAEYGFHVFQVVERLPEEVMPLAAASGEIAARLRREQADRVRASLVQQARARYNVQVYERNLPFEYEGSYGETHTHRPTPASPH